MTSKISLRVPFALAVAAALAATPALAQKGHGHDQQRGHVEHRDDDHADRRRDDDRDHHGDRDRRDHDSRNGQYGQTGQYGSRPGDRHPGWCTGRGNPHNTVANCGNGSDRYDPRYDPRNGSYGNRNPTVYRNGSANGSYGTYGNHGTYGNGNPTVYRNGTYGQTGSYSNGAGYSTAHEAYHRQLDRECRAASARRPNDRSWQLRVRSQCTAQHQQWHDRYTARTRR